MNVSKIRPTTIDEYIREFPEEIQIILTNIREIIRESAPKAEEAISYQIPTFKLKNKNLVHFGAFNKHIGFYPTPSGIVAFQRELSRYESSKGTVKFPLKDSIPYDLIKKIVEFKVHEVLGE